MKSKLFVLPLLAIALTACQNQSSSSECECSSYKYLGTELSIISPTGAPALAFYNYATNPKFETNAVPTNIVATMNAGQKDIVVLPTNAGVQAIVNKNAPYKIAATLTFGNFYIASMGNDTNNTMDANDTILLFQKNNVPDKIFHYIYGDALDSVLHYVEAVSDVAKAAISGTFVDPDTGTNMTPNYVLIAEPALSTVRTKKSNIFVYSDLQEEYKKKSNNLEIFQASVFVKNDVEYRYVDAFLSSLKKDVEAMLKDSKVLKEGLAQSSQSETIYGVAPETAVEVLEEGNGMGLGFKYAKENKASIDQFLSLFNIATTDEKIYY